MEFLVLLFIGWFIWSVVKTAQGAKAKQLPPPGEPTVTDWYALSQSEQVRMVGPAPAAVLPARTAAEESSSELLWDELAGDTELDAGGTAPVEVVALEVIEERSVAVRPLPGAAVSLEHEVDWEAEHERFHRKYVDGHSAGSAARHGLLDEMRDPGALRRALLMAEILGPPKSLRK
ncbi:hypothetical protein [Longimicrobium sp.]|uniref:hypothetical protein n=1 Tax=Longimicrobium sp. TaxID=2029185 RepID=UPI003B3A3FED